MVINLFKIFGVIGLILIISGIITKKRKIQDVFYIFGGLFLLSYSISLKDIIFIILQSVFSIAALYDLIKLKYYKK